MKKINRLLIIIGILLSVFFKVSVSVAQNEHEFAPVGTVWHYGLTFATESYMSYNTYQCVKDTIIDSKQCKLMHEMAGTCNNVSAVFYLYQDSNKIYYSQPDVDSINENEFLLLYDFGKTKGESWTIVIKNYDMYNVRYDSLLVTVIDVRDTVMGKDTLNFMDVTINHSYCWFGLNGKIYKFIGHEHDLFPFIDGACDMKFNFMLRCYEDNNNSWFYDFDTLHACDYSTLGIVNVDNTISMDIYPNPANDKIIVKSEQTSMKTLCIYDIVGKEVNRYTVNDMNTVLDVNNLSRGIYFLKIETEKGTVSKRFVKE